jgi:Helix-turn-helix domain
VFDNQIVMRILSTKQTAKKLGVTPRKIRAMILEGKIIAQKLENEYAILESDILDVDTSEKPFKTIFDVVPELAGSLNSGLSDLSTNKNYFEGYGRDEKHNR